MTGYAHDITLERRFAQTIKAILGCYFFSQTPWLDQQEATDFAVFTAKPVKVAVRLRRHTFLTRYPNEFTIRWARPSGVETEIDKIRRGLVDYMLYGFVTEDETHLAQYTLCDLAIFRAAEVAPQCIKWNDPPDSQFAAFNIEQFPTAFILKTWQKSPA